MATMATAQRSLVLPAKLELTLLRVAWFSILLGLLMEFLLLTFSTSLGASLGIQPFIRETLSRVAWAFIVCMGLAVGTAALQAQPLLTGLMGLIAGPVAFNVARAIHKGAAQALATVGELSVSLPLALAVIKSLEYGFLGVAIALLLRRSGASLYHFLGLGLATGIFFGGLILALTWQSSPGLATVLSWSVNELLFPVGCSFIIFAAQAVGKRLG